MKINDNYIHREIAGEHVLVPVGNENVSKNGLFILNELGVFLWNHIPQAEDESQLVKLVLDEYEVDIETATKDVHEFMDKLTTIGIVAQ